MKINKDNIDFYLDKFFEGNTDRKEELELSRFFRETTDLPPDLSDMQQMFAWIDNGMKDEEMPVAKHQFHPIRKLILWLSSAAAIFILTFTIVFFGGHFNASANPEIIYNGSYVSHGNLKNRNIKEILPEIQNTLQQIDEMQNEINNLHIETKDLLYDFESDKTFEF